MPSSSSDPVPAPSASPNANDAAGSEQKVARPEQSSLAYIIALITLGAAFGNMFMAGKIRNVMKMEMPKASSAGARAGHTYTAPGGSGAAGASGEYANSANGNAHQRWSQQAQQQAKQDAQHVLYLDPKVSQHLVTLGFTPETNRLVHNYSEQELKKRYRELVLQYHPDRIVVQNPQDEAKKDSFTKKFQLITQSYQYLTKDLDMRRSKEQSTSSSQQQQSSTKK